MKIKTVLLPLFFLLSVLDQQQLERYLQLLVMRLPMNAMCKVPMGLR